MSIPTENTSRALPESRQDANLASTQASRPGNTVPAGVSTEHPSTAPFVDSSTAHTTNDKSLSDSVKNSLDSVAQQTPTTQSVTDQLPSAQQATDALKAGASSLVAGISSLAFGVSDAATKNAADTHPESEKARNVDDFHIPGAFDSATSDREDIADVQRGVQSVSDSLPSSQQVKQTIPGISSRSGNEQIHKDGTDYIKSQLENRNINSVGATSTTNSLAGQVPLEPRGAPLPQVVADSQRQAGGAAPLDENVSSPLDAATTTGSRDVPRTVIESQKKADVSPEASANAEAVREKTQMEQELKKEVPKQTGNDNSAVNLGEAISGGLAAAGAAIVGAATSARHATAESTGTDPVSILPVSAQKAIDGQQVNSTHHGAAVPGVVVESQQRAGVSPEASANLEALQDKKQLEQELQQEVPRQGANNDTAANIRGAVVGGLAAAGTAAAGAATYARQKTTEATGTDPVSVLPESTQQAIDGNSTLSRAAVPSVVSESQRAAGVSPEASANPAAVQDKRQLEQELKREVDIEPASSGQQNLTNTLAQGAVAAGNATANAATYAREKTAQVTGTDPVSVLPQSAQRSIENQPPYPPATNSITSHASASSPTTYPRVVSEPMSGFSSSLAHPDLRSGVHNNVVGDHLDDPETSRSHSSASQVGDSVESAAPVAHIPSFGAVDLKAGVHNGVVGSGADVPRN